MDTAACKEKVYRPRRPEKSVFYSVLFHYFVPLTADEIPNFDLDRMLRYGGLPQVWLSDSPEKELEAYVATYINEEIKMEGSVRLVRP